MNIKEIDEFTLLSDLEYDQETLVLIEAGHEPIMKYGCLDIFVLDNKPHNGPGCSKCGKRWCHHCTPVSHIKMCKGMSNAAIITPY